MNKSPHASVLLAEVIAMLAPWQPGIYVDATFGAGGYTREILRDGMGQVASVFAFDKDPTVAPYVAEIEDEYPKKIQFYNASYTQIARAMREKGEKAQGIVYDLGVSSMQLDQGERGFSFQAGGPLDMRMNQTQGQSAYDLLNTLNARAIADILFMYGDEPKSRAIAKKIVEFREEHGDIKTTTELVKIIENVYGGRGKTHPATKSFQALRIAVNNELQELSESLTHSVEELAVGGKMLAVTFHSGEDKIVKKIFDKLTGKQEAKWDPIFGYSAPTDETPVRFKKLNNKVIAPNAHELSAKPTGSFGKVAGHSEGGVMKMKVAIIIIAACALIKVKSSVIEQQKRLADVSQKVQMVSSEIEVLRAESIYLRRPSRILEVAEGLGLQPPETKQIVSFKKL